MEASRTAAQERRGAEVQAQAQAQASCATAIWLWVWLGQAVPSLAALAPVQVRLRSRSQLEVCKVEVKAVGDQKGNWPKTSSTVEDNLTVSGLVIVQSTHQAEEHQEGLAQGAMNEDL